jgi:hypothetical protein
MGSGTSCLAPRAEGVEKAGIQFHNLLKQDSSAKAFGMIQEGFLPHNNFFRHQIFSGISAQPSNVFCDFF